jgi:membrane protein
MLKKVLSVPTEELGKWSKFAIVQLKLWRQCARLLRRNRSGQQAAALSYHTIFGIVPLAIVILMVFQLFPAYRDNGEKVKVFLYEQMHLSEIKYPNGDDSGSIKLTEKIDDITATFIDKLDKGSITFFSTLIVILAALGLLTTIERAFNSIWHVARPRSFIHRIINYWALLTLGPLLLGLGLYISTHYLMIGGLREGAVGYLRPVLPFLISTVSLFLLYFVMPNTKVNTGSALWGAAVASLIWTLAKHLFGAYVTEFIPYSQIYGIMGLIPLSVFWIFITWWIVLFGLQLTFATQHLKTLDAAELAKMDRNRRDHFLANDFTVIKILGYITEAFERKQAPVQAEVICGSLNLPADFGEKILEHLTKAGLLFQTSEPRMGYSPATDSNNITLGQICDAVAKASFAQDDDSTPTALRKLMHTSRQEFSGITLGQILRNE